MDIDECDSSDTICNIDTQVCYNTPGSYKCLDIVSPESAKNCSAGLRYNVKLDQCDGKQFVFFLIWKLQFCIMLTLNIEYC